MKTLFRSIAAIAASFAATAAMATTVIDFEQPDNGAIPAWYTLMSTTQGFQFNKYTSNMGIFDTSEGAWTTLGAAHSGRYLIGNIGGGWMYLTAQDGGTFEFNGLWMRNWVNNEGTSPDYIVGYRNGVLVGAVEFNMGLGWQHIVANFANVDVVTLRSNDNFLVDDITVNAGVVPEPASFALMGAGLLGLAALRRARRA